MEGLAMLDSMEEGTVVLPPGELMGEWSECAAN